MSDERNDLARARATLGLPEGGSLKDATRAYKRLVSRWHPDRHATDPQGQAEAALQMREINRAFGLVRRSFDGDRGHSVSPGGPVETSIAPRRWTRRVVPSELHQRNIATEMNVESDGASFGRILYWGALLGLAALLILQPSRLPDRRSAVSTVAGLVAVCAVSCQFLIRRWRKHRHERE